MMTVTSQFTGKRATQKYSHPGTVKLKEKMGE